MAGVHANLCRCLPNKPGCEPASEINMPAEVDVPLILSPAIETYRPLEPSSNSHGTDSRDPVAFSEDSVVVPGMIYSSEPSSSTEPPSAAQPRLPALVASDTSKFAAPGFSSSGAPAQNFFNPPTSARSLAARAPRSPPEGRNTSKLNLQYQLPSQSEPPSSNGQPIPNIQGTGIFSGTFETENQDMGSTTTAFAPLTFQYSLFSNQTSKPASKSDAKFHDKVIPAHVPRYVLIKSRKLALGVQLEGGQQHRSGKFWRLTFSPSGSGSRLEYICDNPHSPDCNRSTSQLGDMSRHQEGSTHLPPESSTLTCPLCGDKLKGVRLDALRRHQSLQKCKTKQAEGARRAALFGIHVQPTSQVAGKRGWVDMAGDVVGEDDYPTKVSKYGNTSSFSYQEMYWNAQGSRP